MNSFPAVTVKAVNGLLAISTAMPAAPSPSTSSPVSGATSVQATAVETSSTSMQQSTNSRLVMPLANSNDGLATATFLLNKSARTNTTKTPPSSFRYPIPHPHAAAFTLLTANLGNPGLIATLQVVYSAIPPATTPPKANSLPIGHGPALNGNSNPGISRAHFSVSTISPYARPPLSSSSKAKRLATPL